MGQWFFNKGFNDNLMVQLSRWGNNYQLDVYVVAYFQFCYDGGEGTQNWNMSEASDWKRRFINLVYQTWSEKWLLLSDLRSSTDEDDSESLSLPTARVRVHAVDIENPSVRLPLHQRIYLINVNRLSPGNPRERQRAEPLVTSEATVGHYSQGGVAAFPDGVSTSELYEDSLGRGDPPQGGQQQHVAMHEFGHMLGYMHPNDMGEGCVRNRDAEACYGELYSPERNSIMGRGQEIRTEEYAVFNDIISRLVLRIPREGLAGFLGLDRRIAWHVEGSNIAICNGQLAMLPPSFRGTLGHSQTPRHHSDRYTA